MPSTSSYLATSNKHPESSSLEINSTNDLILNPKNLITWIFDEVTFVLAAKLQNGTSYSIITNHLGTPCQMVHESGNETWRADLDIYGKVRNLPLGSLSDCPFRYQGQYEDVETGLYYNRFRYYDPEDGVYVSQDPIGILGNSFNLYGFVEDTNKWVDSFGLFPLLGGTTAGGMSRNSLTWIQRYGPSSMRDHHLIPQEMLKNKDFMNSLNSITNNNGKSYLHRQISNITNELHNTVHENGWNKQFKQWAKDNPNFTKKELQTKIKSMMKEYNIPKSSRNFAKQYRCK